MSEKIKKFSNDLDRLICEGDNLLFAMQYNCHETDFMKNLMELYEGDEAKANDFLKKLPDFKRVYQKWYSESLAVIKQVLPDRVADFMSHYEYPRVRKDITFQNYMVRDYLQGLRITRSGHGIIADRASAIPEFEQQLNIVKAAKDTLVSTLMDLKAVLQADLFDTEIETAGVLAKGGYMRAAGAVCGVVIEKHLLHVCGVHKVAVKRKNPGIAYLNQLLRDANVITVPQWRFIQHLADIRNICDHAKGREPTKDEIDDLVAGSKKVLKTVF